MANIYRQSMHKQRLFGVLNTFPECGVSRVTSVMSPLCSGPPDALHPRPTRASPHLTVASTAQHGTAPKPLGPPNPLLSPTALCLQCLPRCPLLTSANVCHPRVGSSSVKRGPSPRLCALYLFTAPHRALSTSHTCICSCPACCPPQEQDLCLLAAPPTRHKVSALQAS